MESSRVQRSSMGQLKMGERRDFVQITGIKRATGDEDEGTAKGKYKSRMDTGRTSGAIPRVLEKMKVEVDIEAE